MCEESRDIPTPKSLFLIFMFVMALMFISIVKESASRDQGKGVGKKVGNNLLRVMLDALPHKRVMTRMYF